jgi:hypothetical protein
MTNANSVNICESADQLVGVDLDKDRRHHLLHFQEIFHHPVKSVRDVVHDHI